MTSAIFTSFNSLIIEVLLKNAVNVTDGSAMEAEPFLTIDSLSKEVILLGEERGCGRLVFNVFNAQNGFP